jgi:GDP/UDP-N,N'-diacetylbacillosamine 2-epimerase (hydrolysing)
MSRTRRIAYVSGTRADFGLMRRTLKAIDASPALDLSVLVTGMHLDPAYGGTVADIEASGLPIGARIEVERGTPGGALMGRNIGTMTIGLTDAFEALRPDVVLLLGDRGEMLAGAIAAIHLNIPIAHVHGGERSGTVDEPVRHAISKLAHLHLVATEDSRKRLIAMGEDAGRVVVVGAPGLDALTEDASLDAAAPLRAHGLDAKKPLAILVYHPVLQDADDAEGVGVALDVLAKSGLQVLALRPNSDAGSARILATLEQQQEPGRIALATHFGRREYLSLLRHASILVGNSSSGIIEAASFGTPVVNIGARQNLRERNANVIDTPPTRQAIGAAVEAALARGRLPPGNIYGDGMAAARIVEQLVQLPLADPKLMAKSNAY